MCKRVSNTLKKQFSTCLLFQDVSFVPEFLETEVNLHPGSGFSPDQGKTVLLAGGFFSVSPESRFPLSPTLQLNYDLAMFGSRDLEKIARAELHRFSTVNYRSYTLAADNRVAVIGDCAAKIHTFVDTYGGVLAIEPLLVTEFHPDFPTVMQLHPDSCSEVCRLEYQVRTPLAQEECSYCGSCGPACPEQCISENLFFDYSRCTFCRKCEAACESQAIDIYGVLQKVLEVPAIIVLDGVAIDLPKGTAPIYFEKNLPAYFATLFPSQIDEIVTCNNSICQYSGRLGHGCGLCLASCRYGAITWDGRGVTVDAGKCEECGACVASCPTGALQNERFTDRMFVDYFNKVAIPEDGTVVVGGEQALHRLWWRQRGKMREKSFFLHYDKPRSLSLFHYLHLFQRGARRIVVLHTEEDGLGGGPAQQQLDQANSIIGRLFHIEKAVLLATPEDFDGLWTMPLVGSCGRGDHGDIPFVNRRQALAVALESLAGRSGEDAIWQPNDNVPFAALSCDNEKCTQCMACLNDCRLAALRADRQELTLNHLGALCVGCGICVRICPEDALRLLPAVSLDRRFFAPVELTRAEPMACRGCGKIFGTRKSFLRVMAILAEKEPVDSSHFELCETCRVVKIFEMQS